MKLGRIPLQIKFLLAFSAILVGGVVGHYGSRYQAPVVLFGQNLLQDVPVGSTFGPVSAKVDHDPKGLQFIDQWVPELRDFVAVGLAPALILHLAVVAKLLGQLAAPGMKS